MAGVVPGTQQPRQRPPFPPPVHYPGEEEHRALCQLLNDDHNAAQWERLRAEAWRRWLELVTGRDRQHELFRPPRGPGKDWPPKGAVAHDGFGSYRPQHGGASSPLGIQSQGKPNDLRWHRDLAVAELEHLARFRKRAAAREIREPLAHYAALLRAVRDDPASRVFVDSR